MCVLFTKPSRRKGQVNRRSGKLLGRTDAAGRVTRTTASGGTFVGMPAGSLSPSAALGPRRGLCPTGSGPVSGPGPSSRPERETRTRCRAASSAVGSCVLSWLWPKLVWVARRPPAHVLFRSQLLFVKVWVGTLPCEISRKVALSLWGCDSWF